jgi:hypothetical protein
LQGISDATAIAAQFILAALKKGPQRAFCRVQARSGWAFCIDPDRYGIVLAGGSAAILWKCFAMHRGSATSTSPAVIRLEIWLFARQVT